MKVVLEFARSHPWSSLVMLLCLLVAGLVEGLGLSALLPLVTLLLGSEEGAGASGLEKTLVSVFERLGIPVTAGWMVGLICGAFVLKAALALLARRQVGYTVARVTAALRLRLVRAVMRTSWSYYVQQRVGTFSNSYTTQVRRSAKLYTEATMLVALGIETLVYLGVALATSWRVTIGAAVVGTAMLLVLGRLVRMSRRAGRRQTDLHVFVSQRLTDVLQGVKPLKAMGREGRVAHMLERSTQKLEKAMRKEVLSREALTALQEPLLLPFLLVGLYLGVSWLEMQTSTVVVLGMVAVRAFSAMNKAQRRYQKMVIDESAYRALMGVIHEAEAARERLPEGDAPRFREVLELRDVSLGYAGTPVLQGLSLRVPFGEITALVGPSGAGKTTLVDLVTGLLQPQSGDVLVDGRPLGELDLAAWRGRIGYVPQEMFLLHDTVAANVSLGDPDVGRDRIERALRDAHAWDFVARLPEGMDTLVGERGSALSGGQRQRIAIARALLQDPWLLILDEATAALDPASEEVVWSAVRELRGRAAVLAISHQRALLDVADRAWRLEGGKAVEIPLPPHEDRPRASAGA